MFNTEFQAASTVLQNASVDLAANSEETTEEVQAPSLKFEPGAFVNSLQYMGKGMLGILIVMGAIILVTSLLNRLTSGKKKEQKDEE